MKFILLFISILNFIQTWGQNVNCIFLSSDEFINHKPSLVIEKKKGERLMHIFPKGLGHIKVIKKDTIGFSRLRHFAVKNIDGLVIYKFKAKSIYGYCKNNECYRFYEDPKSWKINDGYHTIEDTSCLFIYSRRTSNGRYGSTLRYYYSLSANDKLRPLTLDNLEIDFKSNLKIVEKVRNDTILKKNISKRNKDGTFRINKVIAECLPIDR